MRARTKKAILFGVLLGLCPLLVGCPISTLLGIVGQIVGGLAGAMGNQDVKGMLQSVGGSLGGGGGMPDQLLGQAEGFGQGFLPGMPGMSGFGGGSSGDPSLGQMSLPIPDFLQTLLGQLGQGGGPGGMPSFGSDGGSGSFPGMPGSSGSFPGMPGSSGSFPGMPGSSGSSGSPGMSGFGPEFLQQVLQPFQDQLAAAMNLPVQLPDPGELLSMLFNPPQPPAPPEIQPGGSVDPQDLAAQLAGLIAGRLIDRVEHEARGQPGGGSTDPEGAAEIARRLATRAFVQSQLAAMESFSRLPEPQKPAVLEATTLGVARTIEIQFHVTLPGVRGAAQPQQTAGPPRDPFEGTRLTLQRLLESRPDFGAPLVRARARRLLQMVDDLRENRETIPGDIVESTSVLRAQCEKYGSMVQLLGLEEK